MICRKLTCKDIPTAFALYSETTALTCSVKDAIKSYKKMLRNGNYLYGCFIKDCYGDRELLGIATVNRLTKYDACIDTIVIKNKYRNKGICKYVLRTALNAMRSDGYYNITIPTDNFKIRRTLEDLDYKGDDLLWV